MVVGKAPMKCQGSDPKVCIPQAISGNLAAVQKDSVSVLSGLQAKGVSVKPSIITDQFVNGRSPKPSTSQIWRIDLTHAVEQGNVRWQVMLASVDFPCAKVDQVTQYAVLGWAASVTNQRQDFDKRVPRDDQAANRAKEIVRDILSKPTKRQGEWFQDSLISGCRRGSV
ncbi:hypothetical protein OG709_25175 [Streptomyces sp. NBC_01267]|uniref:hypothetical protein n=1 Tax=unclassified Streptomyces TaxID=2593676 RepID=UPI002DD8D185|nr:MULTISPECIES: hypothetical protein [unclassified Streptomyces]WSC19835.1 hypothetical protein OIE60_09135 [Streptomyces sp. NBC_01766]